jgi:hypothetical protein
MKVAIFCLAACCAAARLAGQPAGPLVTLEPAPRPGVLLNPGKGWSVFGWPDHQPTNVLALASMGVMRFDWAELEPREGQYEWKRLDSFLEAWGRRGKVCNVGVMCANTHSSQPGGYVTPRWVFDAGAKKIEITLDPKMTEHGTPGPKVAPVFDDPVFLKKWAQFLKAFAARYDGDPRIALLDIRSYGNWGEAHMYPFGVPDIAPEKFRHHVQLHLDAFHKTQLCVSRNSHLGRFGALKPVFDWAVLEKRIAPRRDGICGNSDGSETAIGLGIAPGAFELFGDYPSIRDRGWWEGRKDAEGMGFRLAECVENGHPTWVDLGRGGRSGERMIHENAALIDTLSNRIGYHFHLSRVAYPRQVSGSFQVELAVTNAGVAPIYVPCALAFALIDESGKRVATLRPGGVSPAQWKPDAATPVSVRLEFPSAPPGRYRLALALTRASIDPTPHIRWGTELPEVDGWMVLGNITVTKK